MTKFILTILLLSSLFTFSQSKVDSLIIEIYRISIDNRIVVRPTESKLLVVYKFCDEWNEKIDYLKKELSEDQIMELVNDDNGTFNIIGLLSTLEKNNSKETAWLQLKDLDEKEDKMISKGCGDALMTYTLRDFYLNLLTEKNSFITPEFKFTEDELRLLKIN